MPHPSDAQIAELKAKHSGVTLHLLEYSDGAVVARQPTSVDWKRLVAGVSDKAPYATETYARGCIVWPDAGVLDLLFEEKPALVQRFAEALSELAGAEEKVRAKKL